jgi:nitrite reductase/ring-hydroxylating ferredoxin subunit
MKHPLCKVSEIPETGSKVVPFFGREVHVYKIGGKLRATANVCMHFGGPLECKDGRFVCPWHNAEFSMEDGRCLKAPAPSESKLMHLSTHPEGDTLYYVWGE